MTGEGPFACLEVVGIASPANCRSELISILRGEGVYGDLVTDRKLPGGVSVDDFIKLSYRVANNQDAVVTLSASIGEWAHQASQIATAGNSDNSGEQFKGIQNRYQQSAAALSFLAGMADDKAGWKTGQTRGTVKALSDNNKLAFNVFSTVASAGLGAVGGPLGSAAGKTAMFVGATLSRSNINLDFGSNIIDDERDKSDPSDDQVETPSQQVVHWAEGA